MKLAAALPVEKPVMLVALRAVDHATPDALPAAVEKPVMPVALHVAEHGNCQLFDASPVTAETSKRSTCSPHLQIAAAYRRWLWP